MTKNGTACVGDANPCKDHVCNSSGSCVNTVDDTNKCGTCKQCSAGSCTSVTASSGEGCTDTKPTDCYQRSCVAGACVDTPKGGGTACSQDGMGDVVPASACSGADTCGSGATAGTCLPNHVGDGLQDPTNNWCNSPCKACNGAGACVGKTGLAPYLGCSDPNPTDCFKAACISGSCEFQPIAPGTLTYQQDENARCNTNDKSDALDCYACHQNQTTGQAACTARSGAAGSSGLFGCTDSSPNDCVAAGCNSGSCTQSWSTTSRNGQACAGNGLGSDNCSAADTCSNGVCLNNDLAADSQPKGCDAPCRGCDGSGNCVGRSGLVPPNGGTYLQCTDMTPNDCYRAACVLGACEQMKIVPNSKTYVFDTGTVCSPTGSPTACHSCQADQSTGTSACTPRDGAAPLLGCLPDSNDCTDDACVAGACMHASRNDQPCGDGICDKCVGTTCQPVANATQGPGCTGTCQECNGAGACTNTPKFQLRAGCAADSNPCTDDYCDAGVCTHPFNSNPCSDSSATDCFDAKCVAGACEQQPAVGKKGPGTGCNPDGVSAVVGATECSAADTCDANGVCQPNHLATSVVCGDGTCNNCDGSGSCVVSTPGQSGPGCNAPAGDCSAADTCNASGGCDLNHFADKTPCKSGICEECAGGGCIKTTTGLQGPNCKTAATECSNADTCDDGVCKPNHKAAGTPCGDSSPGDCSIAECDGNGACVQTHRLLADGDPCGNGVCNECKTGACVPTAPGKSGPGCTTAGTECSNPGTCDGSGSCQGSPKAAGTTCTDTNLLDCKVAKCNGSGACDQAFGDVLDGTACGDQSCDECASGVCVPTKEGVVGPGCTADSNPCTFDYCSGFGGCVHPPKVGTSCDDANACTFGDQCTGNSTCVGTPIVCTSDVCGTRSCNGTSECTLVAHDDVDCDADGDKCTPNDKCKAGKCVADAAIDCVQQDCYTTAVCNKDSGECESTPTSGNDCGLTGCYTAGTCSSGVCSGQPVDCSFLDEECMVGVCDTMAPGNDTEKCRQLKRPNGASCTSANKCLLDTICFAGKCEGEAKPCTTTATCRVASCDPNTGECAEALADVGTSCQETNDCKQNATCDSAGNCVGTNVQDQTPCASATDCPGGGACMSGTCICTTEADMSIVDSAPTAADLIGSGGTGPDLTDTNTGGDPPKCGCGATPGEAAPQAMLILVAMWFALRRNRRRA